MNKLDWKEINDRMIAIGIELKRLKEQTKNKITYTPSFKNHNQSLSEYDEWSNADYARRYRESK